MTDLYWLAVALGLAIALSLLVGFLVARKFNKKISGYRSIETAIKEQETNLNGLIDSTQIATNTLEEAKTELSTVQERTKSLVELEARSSEIRELLDNGAARHEELEQQIKTKTKTLKQTEKKLRIVKSDLDLYSRLADFTDFGIFEDPEYLYDTSERYTVEIKKARDKQKKLIADKKAIDLPSYIEVDGSSKKGDSILLGQARLMLRAFNIECDFLIAKTSPSNFDRTLERIERMASALEKSAINLKCGIATRYVKLKYEECRIYYEFKLKKAEEQAEQRLIREQIREEQRAIKEYERAVAAAEQEEQLYSKLLEQARTELNHAHEDARAELLKKVELLQTQLTEAQEKEARAKSLAEQTRRGHVYVISNIGSFGEDIYKIGLTRRLEPLDRVKELGDASVPFPFDVHAIIYAEDAPAMEAALHRAFNQRRVNAVNRRKEFFHVPLTEIKAAVKREYKGKKEVDFRMTILAEEYYESKRLQGSTGHSN